MGVLFDRQLDPAEMHNRVADLANAQLQRQLDVQLATVKERHGGDWRLNSSKLVEEGGRLYRHAISYTIQDYELG